MQLFVMCAQGLENLLVDELTELGIKNITVGFCGVYVADYSMNNIYNINYKSRLASRVLLPLLEFKCDDQDSLYNNARKIAWEKYFTHDQSLAVDSNVNHRFMRNSLYAAQIVKDAICDRLRDLRGTRPSVDLKNPDIQINLFIDEGYATLSFDTSGMPLYKRGYRQATGEAPLQESLAAALLKIARYNSQEVLIDPCCGSATLLIEAALIASNKAPGYMREHWGFMQHPDFSKKAWHSVKDEAKKLEKPLAIGRLWGLELESEVALLAQNNINNAGFEKEIKIINNNFMQHEPLAPYNFLITNAPHGKRLGTEAELQPLYRALGDFMKQKMTKPGRAFVFTSSSYLSKEVGLASKKRHIIKSSGMDARLLEFDLY